MPRTVAQIAWAIDGHVDGVASDLAEHVSTEFGVAEVPDHIASEYVRGAKRARQEFRMLLAERDADVAGFNAERDAAYRDAFDEAYARQYAASLKQAPTAMSGGYASGQGGPPREVVEQYAKDNALRAALQAGREALAEFDERRGVVPEYHEWLTTKAGKQAQGRVQAALKAMDREAVAA